MFLHSQILILKVKMVFFLTNICQKKIIFTFVNICFINTIRFLHHFYANYSFQAILTNERLAFIDFNTDWKMYNILIYVREWYFFTRETLFILFIILLKAILYELIVYISCLLSNRNRIVKRKTFFFHI